MTRSKRAVVGILALTTLSVLTLLTLLRSHSSSRHDARPSVPSGLWPTLGVEARSMYSSSLNHELPVDEQRFRTRVENTLEHVTALLHAERAPTRTADDVPHAYEDKYLLAQTLTNTALAAELNTLSMLGLKGAALSRALAWHRAGSPVFLRLTSSEQCAFVRELTRDVESDTKKVTEGFLSSTTEFTVTTVHEFEYSVSIQWGLDLYALASPEQDVLPLLSRSARMNILSPSKQSPRPEKHVTPPIEVNISWMLEQLVGDIEGQEAGEEAAPTASSPASSSSSGKSTVTPPPSSLHYNFTIDRATLACRTPLRNPDVQASLHFRRGMHEWAAQVGQYVQAFLVPLQYNAQGAGDITGVLNDEGVFVPVLPLMQERRGGEEAPEASEAEQQEGEGEAAAQSCPTAAGPPSFEPCAPSSPLLPRRAVLTLLEEQVRSLRSKLLSLGRVLPKSTEEKLVSRVEGRLALSAAHIQSLALAYGDGMHSIEQSLRAQLLSAIGGAVTPADFEGFMRSHLRRALREEFVPRPLSLSVRRPEHYPEGSVAVVSKRTGGSPSASVQPISTLSRQLTPGECGNSSMYFSLNAGTFVQFGGPRYIHAFVPHAFGEGPEVELELEARSRAFSGFIVLLGTLQSASASSSSSSAGSGAGGQEFVPSHAFLLRNQDELRVPLSLAQLPSAPEFARSILSLSPEQARFAKAFRREQLQGSMLSLVVIQLKPALERLLHLPPGSLTKEVKLTEDILDLFVRYHIPSDQLTFDPLLVQGAEAAAAAAAALRHAAAAAAAGAPVPTTATNAAGPLVTRQMQLDQVRGHVARLHELVRDFKNRQLEEEKQVHEFAKATASPPIMDPLAERATPQRRAVPYGTTSAAGDVRRGGNEPVPMMARMHRPAMEKLSAQTLEARMPEVTMDAAATEVADMLSPAPMPPQADQQSEQTEQSQQTEQEQQHPTDPERPAEQYSTSVSSPVFDLTRVPGDLDAALLAQQQARTRSLAGGAGIDVEEELSGSLRPTRISIGAQWHKRFLPSLLSRRTEEQSFGPSDQRLASQSAFDLLDALSRSGSLRLEAAELHVLLALTHQFDRELLDTLIIDNVNPIDKLVEATATVAAILHRQKGEEDVLTPSALADVRERRKERRQRAGMAEEKQEKSDVPDVTPARKSAPASTPAAPVKSTPAVASPVQVPRATVTPAAPASKPRLQKSPPRPASSGHAHVHSQPPLAATPSVEA